MKVWSAILDAWRRRKAQQVRTIPDSYFRGYRRLADTRAQIEEHGNACWTCRHSVAYVAWHCDRLTMGCLYEPCHVADELTKADLKAGRRLVGGWVGLPDPTVRKAPTPHLGA